MRIPVIKIRDNRDGSVHIVGSDYHDMLCVCADKLTYYNLQNGCGSSFGDEYVFVNDGDDVYPSVEFVTLEEFVKLSEEQISEDVQNTIDLYKTFVRIQEKRLNDAKEETGIIGDTSGKVYE